ncbi:MAG: acyl CoA:acetate/3-ketoacid CoA transferase [Actinomycetota bacterium]|nr:acyl CoA:acetate/3-ketoacid CoA transferase [Actinomycetota bacterium]
MRKKLVSAEEAVSRIKDGATVAVFSFAEEVVIALEERFLKTGHPKDLDLFFPLGLSYFEDNNGLNRFAHPGMVRRIITSHILSSERMRRLIEQNECEAYIFPLGAMSTIFREASAGRNGPGGLITKVGLGTFLDPRQGGGKINQRTKEEGEDLIKLIEWQGEEYLFYPCPKLDVAVIPCSTADEKGNVTIEKEVIPAPLSMAIACKANGGRVIVQVSRYAKADTLYSKNIAIPHIFVDDIVVEKPENSLFKIIPDLGLTEFSPAWTGEIRVPLDTLEPMPHDIDKLAARVALMRIKPNSVVNFGFGISSSVVYIANAEEGIGDLISSALELGMIGGVPGPGIEFAFCTNTDAYIPCDYMFDNIWGGGLDYAFLAFAEIDEEGNANVSRFGDIEAGPGGFVDISHNAKNICFVGTFTTGRMKAKFDEGRLDIEKDGTILKFKKKVQEITFNAKVALERGGRKIYVATERALFEITENGLVLRAIAPGVEVEKDILAKMEFRPIIPEDIETLDPCIFRPEPMGMRGKLLGKED